MTRTFPMFTALSYLDGYDVFFYYLIIKDFFLFGFQQPLGISGFLFPELITSKWLKQSRRNGYHPTVNA